MEQLFGGGFGSLGAKQRSGFTHLCVNPLATLLLAAGVNVKVVSEALGHSSVTITLSIYAHVLPHMQQSAANVMDTLLARPEPRKIGATLAQLWRNWCHN